MAGPWLADALTAAPAAATSLPSLQEPESLYSGLRWRMLGPFRGGRVDAVDGRAGPAERVLLRRRSTAASGSRSTPAACGRRCSTRSRSRRSARSPSRRRARTSVYVGTRRVDAARLDRLRQRRVQVHRRRQDAGRTSASTTRSTSARSPSIRRTRTSCSSRRSGTCTRPNPERGVFRSTRRRQDAGRRCCSRTTNVGAVEVVIDPTNPQVVYAGLWNTRRPPWYTYRAVERPGRRHLQVDRRRHDLEAAHERAAEGGHRQDRHRGRAEQSAARVRGGRLPRAASPARRAGAGRAGGRRRRPRRRAAPPRAGRLLPLRRRAARRGRRMSADPALWGRGWYFEHDRRRSEEPRHRLRAERRACTASKDGGKTWVALRGSPGGDDYHQAWVSPDDSNTMIVASDQGAIITRNAQDRRSARRHVELVAQPADGADLSRVGRLPLPVLGDRRAAGQRRGGGALARQVRRDLDARLGADRRRRRERLHRGRSAAPGHRLRRHGHALRPRD